MATAGLLADCAAEALPEWGPARAADGRSRRRETLLDDERIAAVTFTGSTGVGLGVAERMARQRSTGPGRDGWPEPGHSARRRRPRPCRRRDRLRRDGFRRPEVHGYPAGGRGGRDPCGTGSDAGREGRGTVGRRPFPGRSHGGPSDQCFSGKGVRGGPVEGDRRRRNRARRLGAGRRRGVLRFTDAAPTG